MEKNKEQVKKVIERIINPNSSKIAIVEIIAENDTAEINYYLEKIIYAQIIDYKLPLMIFYIENDEHHTYFLHRVTISRRVYTTL